MNIVQKFHKAIALAENIGVMIGEDNTSEYGSSASLNRRREALTKELDSLQNEIENNLCEHKWKKYNKLIYECEICKTRRFSKEDLCQLT